MRSVNKMNFSKLNAILNWSARVGKLFGIPISLHISLLFFLFPLLKGNGLSFLHTVEYILLVIGSILLHELGHALAAKKYGLSGLSIMLHGFGGFATSSGYRSPTQALVITLAGPAVTFIIGIVCLTISFLTKNRFAFGTEADIQSFIIHSIGIINILLGFLNMIPSYPFDGGNALQAILNRRMTFHKSSRAVGHLGLILSPLLIIYWLIAGNSFIGLFGLMGTVASVQMLLNSGGIRFKEAFQDRQATKDMQAQKKREKQRTDAYLGDVKDREIARGEKERLRKMFEVIDGDADK
jgi:Zn-dependent protease